MEVLTIGIFCALLIICIITGKSILYALLAGLIIFSLYGKKQGYSWRQISRMALQGAWKVKKYSAHIYTDRNADSTLATGWNNSCNHLLYRASDKTIDIFC